VSRGGAFRGKVPAVRRLLVLICLVAVAGLLVAGPAQAIIPPKDCGTIRVKGKRYQIKGDRVSCSTARSWSRRRLTSGYKPRGWTCRNYAAGESYLKFRCSHGIRSYFAIRR
jgi:hypothetical protein